MKWSEWAALAAFISFPAVALAQDGIDPTGTPPGVAPLKGVAVRSFPQPLVAEGLPIDARPPELDTDKPTFSGQTRAPFHKTTPYVVTLITDKLTQPWSLQFLPDGKMLVTEKPGTMRIVDAQGKLSEPIAGVPDVDAIGQVGLLDVALDLHFTTNHRIFFTYSEPQANDRSWIVMAKGKLDETALKLSDVTVVFRSSLAAPEAMASNEGGRIAIAPDGTVFMTVGDRSKSPPWDIAQRLDSNLGKIIHVDADGMPASGNPFVKKRGARPEIWSLGHRSEEGLAFDRQGRLWETEHGPRGGDELNLVKAGGNYGWPIIVHGIDYPGEKIGAGIVQQDGMIQPRYYWDPVIAPSGLTFYHGALFPAWEGDALVGALRGQMLDRLTIKGDRVVNEEALLVEKHMRIRDVRVGPDGAIYVLSDDSSLMKITPR